MMFLDTTFKTSITLNTHRSNNSLVSFDLGVAHYITRNFRSASNEFHNTQAGLRLALFARGDLQLNSHSHFGKRVTLQYPNM